MRTCVLVAVLALVPAVAALAQPVAFVDVAPWHWAFEALEKVASAGIFIGYPTDDRESAANALTQVYDAFVNAADPRAREWAERFLVNLPANWPQSLQRSPLLSFRLDDVRVTVRGDRGTIAFVAAISQRTAGGSATTRSPMRVEVQRDRESRWRVNYASLAASQPQVFK